jgi:cellulose synthase/poly-beta-1,6-N-acetylglucosamine synthase-like glycosyltransferase
MAAIDGNWGKGRLVMSEARVSLVIPGRNCQQTIGTCLQAVVPLLDDPDSRLGEILFVDDRSTDSTPEIVAGFPVKVIAGTGSGPGAARNLGWRAASSPLVWFVDSDCVAEPDALRLLLPHMDDPRVAAVSGSYGNMNANSLLACLVHEEIVERHRRMPTEVDFLATFNVLYRRSALEEVDGFDERFLRAQDAELSFRVKQAGYRLRFELGSRVKHYHSTRWLRYLRAQRHQGYWRVWLHMSYPSHTLGDSYSSLVDHVQPPLAMLSLPALALFLIPPVWWLGLVPLGLLALAQIPVTTRLVRRRGDVSYMTFGFMSFIRAYWRGVGMTHGMLAYALQSRRNAPRDATRPG